MTASGFYYDGVEWSDAGVDSSQDPRDEGAERQIIQLFSSHPAGTLIRYIYSGPQGPGFYDGSELLLSMTMRPVVHLIQAGVLEAKPDCHYRMTKAAHKRAVRSKARS
ncbi:MAG TPA: hypothetical protein VLE72_02350 [Candidatus Saccharimonadales bacterium]|nr:hypothetical protein [Candidatus Saccharimonadales bacterium]